MKLFGSLVPILGSLNLKLSTFNEVGTSNNVIAAGRYSSTQLMIFSGLVWVGNIAEKNNNVGGIKAGPTNAALVQNKACALVLEASTIPFVNNQIAINKTKILKDRFTRALGFLVNMNIDSGNAIKKAKNEIELCRFSAIEK